MKSRINLSVSSHSLIFLLFLLLGSFTASAQIQKTGGRCTANASQVYFVEDGQSVLDVHPGSRGYQLNILGTGVDNFEVIQDPCMTTAYVIPSYTNSSSAKWQINFSTNMERVICSVKMKNKCTGETLTIPLISGVRLFNQ
jgi:hypothetical protein